MSRADGARRSVHNDAQAITDSIGAIASVDPNIPLPSDPEALLWLIQHVHDVWMMRQDEDRPNATHEESVQRMRPASH